MENGSSGAIALCYGTRPQVVKASVLRKSLTQVGAVVAIDTGQHYDYELNALHYEQLGVAAPDHCLEVGSASHAEQTAAILTRAEALFHACQPDIVVVIGDTNSTLGCALAAAKLRIPVVHVEAGLRARDMQMAEEINRRVVDSVAQLLCTPCAAATERMRREHPDAVVFETGDGAYDVLRQRASALPAVTDVLPGRTGDRFIYATLHRAELTDTPELLRSVLEVLSQLPVPVVLAMHPRTRAALLATGDLPAGAGSLVIMPPVGYLESLALTRQAVLVITDSGGVQRECYWLGTPCITVREETEWVETVDLGANRLVSPQQPETLRAAAAALLDAGRGAWRRDAYGNGDAAARVAEAVAALLGHRPTAAIAD
ncbi:MAG: non-hydrolyzing UDP-N-acetylglucosamine 2-epimerase [Gemmatimonadota bacterium]